MLPDFPKVKQPITDRVNFALRRLVNSHPMLQGIGREFHQEGRSWAAYGESAEDKRHSYEHYELPHGLPVDELIADGPQAIVSRIPDLARPMAESIVEGLMKRIQEAAADENVTAARSAGNPQTFDEYLDALRGFKIEFGEDGKPRMPTMLITDPSLEPRIRGWLADPECREKLKALVEEKKVEFDARESNRTLAD